MKEKQETGKVYIVGAGCGDSDLITVKGLKALNICDVVLYDHLSSQKLLDNVSDDCEKIDVGKSFDDKKTAQNKINKLLIEYAKKGKTVVRLKGGDPYIFGRGGEEMISLKNANIFCEEIPGITSAIAAPASCGIPLTHRGLSRNFTVITASSYNEKAKKEELAEIDYDALIKLNGTIVILMGMHHIDEIMHNFIVAGMDKQTPAAVIMNGATQNQICTRGTIETISQKSKESNLKNPSVIIIGQTVGLDLNNFKKTTFDNVKIGVVGTKQFVKKTIENFNEKGAFTKGLSFLNLVETKEKLPDLKGFSWLVFTSPNGIEIFFKKINQAKLDIRNLLRLKFAVIGEGSFEKLKEHGIYADLMPGIYDSTHLGKAMSKAANKEAKILICRSINGSEELVDELKTANCNFVDFPLYSMFTDKKKRKDALNNISDINYLIFGSASGVTSFFEGLKEEKTNISECVRIVCIGDKCAETLKKYKFKNILVAKEFTIKEIVKTVELNLKKNNEKVNNEKI